MSTSKYLLLLLILNSQLFGGFWFQKDTVETYEEEVYLSLRYNGIIDEIIVAYYDGETFFLPLTELFDIFAINYEPDPSSFSVKGYYLKEDNRYNIDFSRFYAEVGGQVWTLKAQDFRVKEIDYYLTPNLFREIFGLGVDVDISRLTIRLEAPEDLPIISRYSRRHKEELRQRYNPTATDENYDLLYGRQPSRADGAFLDYSAYTAISENNKYFNLNLGLGGEVLFGDIQGNILSTMNRSDGSLSTSDLRWRYVDESQPWYSTVTVGQQSTVGLLNQTYQGVQVTNEPLVPKRSYDSYVLDGITEPEAEIELYQDSRLVDVIKADDVGYYRFMVPLSYGQSNFKIRIFARQGRIIELDRKVQIPFSFLPVNEVRYQVGAGRLASQDLPWSKQREVISGGVNMGLKNWLTGGIGAEYIEGNNQDKPVFFSKLSSRLSSDILVGFDAVFDNYYKLTVRRMGANGSSFNTDYTYYDNQSLYNVRGYVHQFTSNYFQPFSYGAMRFTGRGTFSWSHLPGEDIMNYSVDVTQFIKGFRLQYGLKERHSFSSSGHVNSSDLRLGTVYIIPRNPMMHPLIRGTYLRSDLSFSTRVGQFDEWRFQYIKQFSSRLKAQSLMSFDLMRGTKYFEVGVSWDLDALRSTTSVRTIRSTPSFIQTVRGSVGWDRNNNDILFDNRQQVGRSGVTVRMFVDDDNSGTYDEGEELLPGNALTIERSSSRQVSKNGVTRMTQLQPYRRYNFKVNEARVNNPMLVASHKTFSIVTDPNRYKQLDVPFFTTGVIDGRVDKRQDGELVPISGLRVHIRAVEGDFEKTVRTFGDGSFYSMEIPPGRYGIYVDDAQLVFLRAISVPASQTFTVQPSAEGDYVEGLNFILE